jgi:autotransporter-associated beta strand protein
MLRTRLTGREATVFLLALVSAPPAVGQTWTGNSSNAWSGAANWSSGTVPVSGIDTQLTFGAAGSTSPQNNLAGNFQLNRLTFGAGSPAYTLTGNPLDFQPNSSGVTPQILQNSANAVTIANNLTLTDRLTLGGTGTGTLTLNGTRATRNLTVSTPGTVVLGGQSLIVQENVVVDSGTLAITSLGSTAINAIVEVKRDAVFRIDATTGSNGAAILHLNLNGGTFRVPAGSATYNVQQLTVGSSGGTPGSIDFTGSSGFELNFLGTPVFNVHTNTTWTGGGLSAINNENSSSPAEIATNGFTITNGIRMTGSSGFRVTGGGTLLPFNALNSAPLIADGGTLEVVALSHLGTGTVTLQKSGTGDPGTLKYTGITTTSTKPLVLGTGGGRVWVTDTGTNLTLSGTISEATPGQSLIVSGDGAFGATLTLTGANTYSGATRVLGGAVLSVPFLTDGGLPGPLGIPAGVAAELVLGADGTPGRLRYTGPTTVFNRGITFGPGTLGSVEVTDPAANLLVGGQFTGGAVTKLGPGSLTLLNPSATFTGDLFVNGGAFVVAHPLALPANTNVEVSPGAEFRITNPTVGNAADPIGTVTLRGRLTANALQSAHYYLKRIEQAAGGAVDLTGGTDFRLHLSGPGVGVAVTGSGTWTGGGTSALVNDTAAPLNLSIDPGARLTSSLRLENGSAGQGFRVTGGGTLVVANTDNAAALTVGPATLQTGTVFGLGLGTLTFDGGTLAYTGPTAGALKPLTLAAGGGTVSVTDPAATLTLIGPITGANTLTKTGPGTLSLTSTANDMDRLRIDAGRVNLATDASLGPAQVVVNPAGTLRYTGSTTTARTFTLNGGTLEVDAGRTLTLNGASVGGGFLASTGTGKFALTNSATVNGATLFGGTTVDVAGPAALANVTTGANVTVTVGQPLTLTRGLQTSAGTLTVNGSVLAPQGWESAGVLRVTGGASPGQMTVGGAPLVLGGGSRTFVGANAVGQRGGTILLGGGTLELNGGLLVNNGDFVAPNSGGIQQGTVNVNYGSLAKGSGYYDAVNVIDGGKFAPGNSITDSVVGSLTFNSGSVYEFEINRATGLPGGGGTTPPQGWDRLSMSRMTVNATPDSPAIIQLVTRNPEDTTLGNLTDFDRDQSYRWQAFGAEVFTGFSPDKFTFDTSQFLNLTNPAGVGTFGLELTGSSVFITYTPVPEPGLVVAVAAAGLAAGGLIRRRVTRMAHRRR